MARRMASHGTRLIGLSTRLTTLRLLAADWLRTGLKRVRQQVTSHDTFDVEIFAFG